MWFNGNKLQPSMANSSETNLKSKVSLKQKQSSPQITLSVAIWHK